MRILAPLLVLSVAGCATTKTTPPVQTWQSVVTPEDRIRLRDWRKAFIEAIEQAQAPARAVYAIVAGKAHHHDLQLEL